MAKELSYTWPNGCTHVPGGSLPSLSSGKSSDAEISTRPQQEININEAEEQNENQEKGMSPEININEAEEQNENQERVMHLEIDVNEAEEKNENQEKVMVNQDAENSCHNKRRKLNSKVWDDFTKRKGQSGKEVAVCNHCGREFDGSSKKGTTHLKNHLQRCPGKRNGDVDKFIKSVIDAIGLRMNSEHWDPLALNSKKDDILQFYNKEKEKLCRLLNKLSCRFSLTIEWCANCCLLVVHYINDGWDPMWKVISVQDVRFPYSILLENMKRSCLDWQIDRDICMVITTGDNVISEINSWVCERGSLHFGGQMMAIGGLVEILLTFVENLSSRTCDTVGIRRCFRDVFKSTPSNEHKFRKISAAKVKSMGNKTYGFEQLEIAVGLKKVLCELVNADSNFKSMNLTKEDWHKATVAYERIKALHDVACSLSESKCKTANAYFPKVCDIYMKLLQWERSEDDCVGKIALEAREIFVNRYWMKYELILVIAAVLDPRFKMDIVQLWYKEIYASAARTHLEKINGEFNRVYNEYAKGSGKSRSGDASSSMSFKLLDAMGRPCTLSHGVFDDGIASPKSELDCYLNEPKFPRVEEFDILAWWRVNTPKFPTLARMARDFLAMPISPSAAIAYACFSKEAKDIFDTGLDNDLITALVCLKGWL
ncbi:zinc finger BED domain-containing protein RICESLEEPER 2-like isoform X1 [Citrus sinensis]|uniref:zinc finger BED domain-containing protein RICESLEEPER 2-like isoform X1 n=1 Tax=Citrus sinensis TaxID=2711 RepID=UPI0007636AF8|nr:zinc finger BED domain-containing protein RICESLEEPER 2-like isoform X1 [Citrus sinensis]XP_015387012.1 zinc finger BED domain-containing protein RICESLEEPER 2-like isoform X1 [Citrus sinensis]